MGSSKLTAKAVQENLDLLQGLPVEVQSWEVEVGPDATEDLAVWVWATLTDEDFDVQANRDGVRDRVSESIRETYAEADPWVYVRFRARSESLRP
jgi:hypothetical protein